MTKQSFEFKNGRLKMQRIGVLTPQRQRDFGKSKGVRLRGRNPRAPEKNGLWATVFPYFDPYLAFYQCELVLPPRLRSPVWQELRTMQDAIEETSPNSPEIEALEERIKAIWDERSEYLDRPSVKDRLRVREFWVSGSIYTHLGSSNYDSEWTLMPVSQVAAILPKQYAKDASASWSALGKNTPRTYWSNWPTSTDHLEVFIGRGAKIH